MKGKDTVPPIHRSSVFQFESLRDLTRAVETDDYVYSRWTNPTVRAAEEFLKELEGADDALAFSSGMAAITTLLLSVLKKRDRCLISKDVYGGTFQFARDMLPQWGIELSWVDVDEEEKLLERIKGDCRLVYIETPTNPLLRILPIKDMADRAHSAGALLAVDSTFATPVNQSPLSLGADLVVHSASKFLGGHNDLIGGFVAASRPVIEEIGRMRRLLGGVMDPQTAFLCWRGMKTLALRTAAQSRSTQKIAEYLASCAGVKKVWYPGLQSHPDFQLACEQMTGSGSVVSFELQTTLRGVHRFVKSLTTIRLAPSLGGCDSLITHPASTSHAGLSRNDRRRAGISDSLFRLSIGLEDPGLLIEDLDGALRCIHGTSRPGSKSKRL
jgi:cystathionine gamma-synthase